MYFLHKNQSKRVPKYLQEYMRRKFMLSQQYLAELRCIEYQDVINGQPVGCFRIFKPQMTWEQHIPVSDKADLERHPELILFEGYSDAVGIVHMEDLRTVSY